MAPKQLTADDLCKRFKWTPEQFRLAVAQGGFPRRAGYRTNASTIDGIHPIWGEGETITDLWNAQDVEAWVGAIRSLGVGR